MGSDLQGQISLLFDGHGMYFLFFLIQNQIPKRMMPHNPYLAMLEKADISGSI